MRGTMTTRGGAALTVLLMLAGVAAAQTAGGMSREHGTDGARAMPQTSEGSGSSAGSEQVKGNSPYNNQTKKLSNPLGANGK